MPQGAKIFQLNCPPDAELLAWLQVPFEVERDVTLTAHFDSCVACQNKLETFDKFADEKFADPASDFLLDDLRREAPADVLESEIECIRAAIRAAEIADSTCGQGNSHRQPNVLDVEALTHRGHYEILGLLGKGGMGVVYKARNLKMNRLVAIKVLPPLKPQDPSATARFEREMKAAARLIHPNIVHAYDADEADGKHFLVMEYLEGMDLKALVKTQGPLSVTNAVRYIVQAARGLQHAHEHGITHRDVKPANLMLAKSASGVPEQPEQTIKVLDLGLARCEIADETSTDLTDTGMVMGTADYLAPEQAWNPREIDGRADIYSLGCSLYYLLTGKNLYDGDTVLQKVLAHREKPIPLLRDACPAAPGELEKVFEKMVAKRPEERFQSMTAVIGELEAVLAASTGPARADSPSGSNLADKPIIQPSRLLDVSNRRRWRGILLIVILALGGVPLAAVVLPWPRQNDQTPAVESVSRDDRPPAPREDNIAIPVRPEPMLPGSWFDLLAVTPVGGIWKKTNEGIFQSPVTENSVIQVPVAISGSYVLKTTFTRKSGDRSVNVYFPVSDHVGVLYLDINNANSLVVDGTSKNVKSAPMSLKNGKRYELVIKVTLHGNDVTIDIDLDGHRNLEWAGAKSHLQHGTSSGSFALGSRDGDTIFHELQLWLIDGQAIIP
jgi:serine/threonine protein kinase